MKIQTARGIEDILYEKGLIDSDELSSIKFERVNKGRNAEDIIKERNYVDPKQLVKARGEYLEIPYVELSDKNIPNEVLDLVPQNLAEKHTVIPFKEDRGNLHLAMADPLDLQLVGFVEKKAGLRVKPYIAYGPDVQQAISDQYRKTVTSDVTEALRREGVLKTSKKMERKPQSIREAQEVIREAPVARIVSTILDFAVRSRASDIHIEPTEEKTRVRYRVDGVLQEKLTLPKNVHPAVISRIKILSDLKIDEHRVPQDGRFQYTVDDSQIDLRVSTLPTVYGEKVVMRILRSEVSIMDLGELGLRGLALKRIKEGLRHSNGIILVTGPTGSGKTVTLASCLSIVNTMEVNIISLEDPVEIRVPGVSHVQINPQVGLTFASGLRSILRQDPDIIMVGEIRDSETARLAVHAALTGHLVFSTVHTNSASGTLARMVDMGVESYLLVPAVTVIVAQRLVREICPNCKKEYQPADKVKDDLKKMLGSLYNKYESVTLYKGEGCNGCAGSGYAGRTGIFEALTISDKISSMILENKTAAEIERQAVEEGMVTLKQDGYLKAIEGHTTIEEVLRVTET